MTTTTERMLPLYEAKMIHQFDHRWATYEGLHVRDVTVEEKADPSFKVLPRYWIENTEVESTLSENWVVGFRDIARATDERTTICANFPRAGVGNKLPILRSSDADIWVLPTILSSFAQDFVSRTKISSTSLNFFLVKQFPVIPPSILREPTKWGHPETPLIDWIGPRVAELEYMTHEVIPASAQKLECGGPFVWNSERRSQIRAELDAAFFYLYGIVRSDVDYIMDTFPIVKRKDESVFGEFQTKRLILEAYDAMQVAIVTGVPFESTLNPPPGQGLRHPAKETVS